jgi:hypothetical protein
LAPRLLDDGSGGVRAAQALDMPSTMPPRAQSGKGVTMPKGRPRKHVASATQPAKASKANGNGANLGFEAQMFLAADKLRKNLEPSD